MLGSARQSLRNAVVTVALLLCVTFGLFAQYSAGLETTTSFSTGFIGTYEDDQFRGKFALHLFLLDYLRGAISGGGDSYAYEPPIVCKVVTAWRITPWEHHVFYAGAGMFGHIDAHWTNWTIGFGPALQYAWKFPSRQLELSFDFLLPLLFKDNYVDDSVDDFPSTGSLVKLRLLFMGPSVGISWTF